MARRRFDLKVELQAIRLPFDIPAPSTFVKRRRAIPTFGSRQAPRHECRLRGTRMRLLRRLHEYQAVFCHKANIGRAVSMKPPVDFPLVFDEASSDEFDGETLDRSKWDD